MADYYQEMGWEPLAEGQAPNHMVHFERFLRDFGIFLNEEGSNDLAPPASKTVVENLPNVTISDPGAACPVCLKHYLESDTVKKLPCKHTFHAGCILPWLSKTNSCPLCRFELATDDKNYEEFRKEKLRAKEREADIQTLHSSMFS